MTQNTNGSRAAQVHKLITTLIAVTAVLGMTVAFSGAAAAQQITANGAAADVPGDDADVDQTLATGTDPIELTDLSDESQHRVTIDLQELSDAGVDLSSATVSVADSDVSVTSDGSAAGSTATVSIDKVENGKIQLVISLTGSGGSAQDNVVEVAPLTLEQLDTSGVASSADLTHTIQLDESNDGSVDWEVESDEFNVATIEVENLATGEVTTHTDMADAIAEANDPSGGAFSGSAGDQVEIRPQTGTYSLDMTEVPAGAITDDNTRIVPMSGADVTIQHAGGAANLLTVDAANVEISGITFDGATLVGSAGSQIDVVAGASATIDGNTFQDASGIAGDFVVVSDGASSVSVTGNTFTGDVGDSDVGLYVYDGTGTGVDFTATNNELDGFSVAFGAGGAAPTLSSVTIENNDFMNNDYHVFAGDEADSGSGIIDLDTIKSNNAFDQHAAVLDSSGNIVNDDHYAIYGDLDNVDRTDANTAGRTTLVSAGDHTISSTFSVSNDDMTIRSPSGTSPSAASIDVTAGTGIEFTGDADSLTISGLTFVQNSNNVIGTTGSNHVSNLMVVNNRFVEATGDDSININSGDILTGDVEISNNEFRAADDTVGGYAGIYINDIEEDGAETTVTINGNTFDHVDVALDVDHLDGDSLGTTSSPASNPINLNVVGNTIKAEDEALDITGIDVATSAGGSGSVTIRQNTITANDDSVDEAVEIDTGSDEHSLTIRNNVISGFNDDDDDEALALDDSDFDADSLTITDNNFDSNARHINWEPGASDTPLDPTSLIADNNYQTLAVQRVSEGGTHYTDGDLDAYLHGTIESAVEDVDDDGVFVEVSPGTYEEKSIDPDYDMTILSTDGPSTTTIVGVEGDSDPIFENVDYNTEIRGFTIDSSSQSPSASVDMSIQPDGSEEVTIRNNVFVGADNRDAIHLEDDASIRVVGNEISGYDRALVSEDTTDTDTTSEITRNHIHDNNVGVDIDAGTTDGTIVNFNDIVNNGVGIETDDTDATEALGNWWGDESGPSGPGLAGSGDEIAGSEAGATVVDPWASETVTINSLPTDQYVVVQDPEAPIADGTETANVLVAVLNETLAGNADDSNTVLVGSPSSPLTITEDPDSECPCAATAADPVEYEVTSSSPGDYDLTAKHSNGVVPQGTSVQPFAGEPADVQVEAESNTLIADGTQTVNVTLTVVDANGNAVSPSGATSVTWAIDNGSAAGVTRVTEETDLTDSSPGSEARLEISADNAGETLTIDGIYDESGAGFSDSATVDTVQDQLNLDVSPSTVTANNETDVTVNVTAASTGNPVQGADVSITGPGVDEFALTGSDGSATLTVNASSAGTLDVEVSASGYSNGTASITVESDTSGPVVVGSNPATSVSQANGGDGNATTLEDVNGNGAFDIVDVQALFDNRNSDAVQNNEAAFDFNNQGGFDIVDVQRLFQMVQNA